MPARLRPPADADAAVLRGDDAVAAVQGEGDAEGRGAEARWWAGLHADLADLPGAPDASLRTFGGETALG
jgi:hypothetical protein